MANSADPDQLVSWQPTDLDLHCLQSREYLGSAGPGFPECFKVVFFVFVVEHMVNLHCCNYALFMLLHR